MNTENPILTDDIPDPCPICGRPNYHPSDHHMVPKSRGGRTTETICADCHRSIHSLFPNKELEEKYNTTEILLANEDFARMVKFISKRDPRGRVTTKKSKDRIKRGKGRP